MNKKLLVGSILAVLMLVTITYASAINTNTTDTEKKESPLYRIRTRQAIGEKISQIFNNIKAKFLGERIFFQPIIFLLKNRGLSDRAIFNNKEASYKATESHPSCTYCC